jgi:small subunit ribosomal protein S7
MIPHSFGKMTSGRFKKAEMSIVERLANKIMRSGQGKRKLSGKYIRGRNSCGKKLQTLRILERAFDRVEKQANQNPLQVLVKAIENSAPREDTTRIKRGGVMYTVSVDLAPLRRVDEALKNIALAAFQGSFGVKTSAEEALAKELILAAKGESSSFAVKRRDEVERIAKASR